MAAISAVFMALCSAGDKVVATRQLYGNTYSLLHQRLPRYGIEAVFCDLSDHAAIEGSLEGARLLFCETISNPLIQACDIPGLAELAASAGVPLVVDNTFASPVLCRPLEHGAAVVVHSVTKALGGHHDLLGGIVCAGPDLLEPVAAVGRDLGPTLAPFNAWLALRGIATLPLRVRRSCDSALTIARALQAHPAVDAVYYPALESDPGKPVSDRLFGGRGGTTLGFDVAGGRRAAAAFQDLLRLVIPAASLGGTHSLIVHAASVTHTQLSPEELRVAGISEGFCRLSVGLEDPGDLVDDISSALEAAVT